MPSGPFTVQPFMKAGIQTVSHTQAEPGRSLLMLDPEGLSRALGISRKQVYVLVERGEIDHYRLGRRIRFSQGHIDRFLESVEQRAG
jgi:excisionase family DNA binding protein